MKTPASLRPEFLELAKISPSLLELEHLARCLADTTPARRRLAAFYAYIKPRVCALAGWDYRGRHAELKTMEAYDTVYFHCCYIMEFPRYR